MVDFILGIIVGVFGLFVIAWHFANKQKTKPEAKPQGVAAVSMDMNNNGGVTLDTTIDRDTLRRVFRNLENGIS
jgi:hypothetical protein